MTAQTSDRISTIAGKYLNLTSRKLAVLVASDAGAADTAQDIRAMAASCLRQDEVKGIRKLWRKATGQ